MPRARLTLNKNAKSYYSHDSKTHIGSAGVTNRRITKRRCGGGGSNINMMTHLNTGQETEPEPGNMLWTKLWSGDDNTTDITIRDLAIDSNNNVYIGGITKGGLDANTFQGGITEGDLDGNTFQGGYTDIYLRKTDSNGNILWTRTLGSSGSDIIHCVKIDSNNNVYVAGYTEGAIGENNPLSKQHSLVAKYDSNGNLLWTRTLGTDVQSDRLYTNGAAIDSNNNVYLCGYSSAATIDGNVNMGKNDIFLIKYDSNGNKQWTKTFGSDENDAAIKMTIDSNNNIYMTGYTTGDLFGNTNTGSSDIFTMKCDSNGNKLWTQLLGSTNWDDGCDIITDTNNNIYVLGKVTSDADGHTITNEGSNDIILIKYESNGNKLWSKTLSSTPSEQFPTTPHDFPTRIAIDSNNNLYIIGTTYGDFEGNTLVGWWDVFCIKYDSNGNKLWNTTLGTTDWDDAYGVGLDSNNSLYIAGHTKGSLGGNTHTDEGGAKHAFLTKYSEYSQ
jgi:hypothetical protein